MRAAATLAVLALLALAACGGVQPELRTRASYDMNCPRGELDTQPAATEPVATTPATDATASTDGPTATEAAPASDLPPWTVMLYSIADTNLEPFMMDDVTEMATVGTTANVNMVALVDRAVDYSADPVLGLGDWTGGKVLEIGQGSALELADWGDIDTGDPALLASFITQAVSAYPAQHYALILSDHGASWPGVGGDESAGGNGLTLAEIQDGISTGLDTVGVDQLDLLGFDACLMATYEVASTLAPLAQRMVASEELERRGWSAEIMGDITVAAVIGGLKGKIMDEHVKVEILAAHADRLSQGQDATEEYLALFPNADSDVSELMQLAARVHLVLGPVYPNPAFRRQLKLDLLDAARARGVRQERSRYLLHQWAHGPQWSAVAETGDTWRGVPAVRKLPGLDADIGLVPLHGHTRGHSGVLVGTGDRWLLHAGDAYFHHAELDAGGRAPMGLRMFQSIIQMDGRQRHASQDTLRRLHRDNADLTIISAHDPVELRQFDR